MSENDKPQSDAQNNDLSQNNSEDWLSLEDENFEDAEFDEDDFQDSHDDPDAKSSKKNGGNRNKKSAKKSSFPSFTSLTLLALLGGGGYYYFTLNTPTLENLPVIQSDVPTLTEAETAPDMPEASNLVATTPEGVIPPDQTLPVPVQDNNTAANSTQNPAIEPALLTPMPDDAANLENAALPPLEVADNALPQIDTLQAPDAPMTDNSQLVDNALPDASIAAAPELNSQNGTALAPNPPDSLLSEQTLTAQTEKPFVPAPIPQPEKPADIAAAAETLSGLPPLDSSDSAPAIPAPAPAPAPAPTNIVEKPIAAPKTAEPSKPVVTTAAPAAPAKVEAAVNPTATAPEIEPKPQQPALAEKIIKTPAVKTVDTIEAPKDAAETKPVSAAPVKKAEAAPKPVKQAPVAEKPVKVEPPPAWQLRSAQPGSAVIYDADTGNMQNIEVGDKVKGIGRVKSISTLNGKWVVQGTSGSIKQ
jgi:hypothetical protein